MLKKGAKSTLRESHVHMACWRTGVMDYWILKWKEVGLVPSSPSLREGDVRERNGL